MKKKNDKGFMLAETLIVTTFVASVLIYLFIQFTNLSKSYDESYIYNTAEGLYALEDIKNYIYFDQEALYNLEELFETVDYVDISDCSIFTDKEYCENLFELENIDEIIITKNINEYNNYFDSHASNVCNLEEDSDSSGSITTGDKISCDLSESTDNFYVVENDGTNIQMITEYNIDPSTNRQSDTAGTVAFSTTNYWSSSDASSYIYDENNDIIEPIINNYVDYLDISSASGKLLSISQIWDLDLQYECSYETCNCMGNWIYPDDFYWLGSFAGTYDYIDYVYLANAGYTTSAPYETAIFGVRPVITISENLLKNETYSEGLKNFVNRIDNTDEETYRIIASFNDGKHATIRFGG